MYQHYIMIYKMQYTLPIDILGNIAEYGGLVSLPKEEILARILTIDPEHNFKKDYLSGMYKQLALESEYGEIVRYCYKHDIRIGVIENTRVPGGQNLKSLRISKLTQELRDMISWDGYRVSGFQVQIMANVTSITKIEELKFYWNLYNCVLSFENANENYIDSIGFRESQSNDQTVYQMEVIPYYINENGASTILNGITASGDVYVNEVPRIAGFSFGSLILSSEASEGFYLNCIGIINSLGLRYVPEESYTIPDQFINPYGLEWYDLFERYQLLEILRNVNALVSFKRKNIGTPQELLLQILNSYDIYIVMQESMGNVVIDEVQDESLFTELSLAFNTDEQKVFMNDNRIILKYPIYKKFQKLYIAYNDVNYGISDI